MAARRALILLFSLLLPPSTAIAQQPELGASLTSLGTFRGQDGKRLTLICTPGRPTGQVYGTDVYTDDSAICAAAVHAGITTAEKGGPVTVVIGPGQQRFPGSSRNGVTSQQYAEWPGSFSFDQRSTPAKITWGTTARGTQGYTGSVAVICPEAGRVTAVWGTDAYTGDSSICSAAVHAGAISLEKGGPVTLKLTEGRKAYQGSSRHGVVSREFGSWESSFEVAPAGAEAVAAVPTPVASGATLSTAAPSRTESPTITTATAPDAVLAGAAPRGDSRATSTAAPAPVAAIVSATGFKGVAGPKYSQLSWNAAPGAVGYGLTRYDPTTQQRITLRWPTGDTVFAGTAYTDTAVTPNRTYGYRLRTHFHDANGDLVTDPDTSQGVAVTPKDPNAPLALPPDFQDSVKIRHTLSSDTGTVQVTLSWDWRTGAQGYRINLRTAGSDMVYLVGWNGAELDQGGIERSGANTSYSKFVGPYASTQLRWPRALKPGTYTFCIFAASPIDPTTGRRVESRPGMLKLTNLEYSTGGKWVVEPITYYGGQNSCPSAPRLFAEGK